MIDLGVALTWIAITAASAKGLAVFARAAAATDLDAEPTALAAEGGSSYDGYPAEPLGRLQSLHP